MNFENAAVYETGFNQIKIRCASVYKWPIWSLAIEIYFIEKEKHKQSMIHYLELIPLFKRLDTFCCVRLCQDDANKYQVW